MRQVDADFVADVELAIIWLSRGWHGWNVYANSQRLGNLASDGRWIDHTCQWLCPTAAPKSVLSGTQLVHQTPIHSAQLTGDVPEGFSEPLLLQLCMFRLGLLQCDCTSRE